METASRRQIGGVGDFPGKKDTVLLSPRFGPGNRRKQGLGVGMPGLKVYFFRGGQFHQASHVHHPHPVGYVFDYRKIMGDKEKGRLHGFFKVLQQVENLGLDGHVQGGDRLVGDDEAGL
jgi:hypothetical protein